jgi:hypothetical protein
MALVALAPAPPLVSPPVLKGDCRAWWISVFLHNKMAHVLQASYAPIKSGTVFDQSVWRTELHSLKPQEERGLYQSRPKA